jgi:ethylmalonyl-CoA/methylmalonyl-CoA decarboxylase
MMMMLPYYRFSSACICQCNSTYRRVRLTCRPRAPRPLLQTTTLALRCLSKSSSCSNISSCNSSVLGIPRDELREIREHLRQLGSIENENSVTLQDATTATYIPAINDAGVVNIMTLSNVTARNALTGKMMAEMADCVDSLESNFEKLTALVVRGADGFFCAGADLGVAKEHLMTKEGGRMMSALMTDTLTRLYMLPVVTVAAIEGMAIGGGAELITAMDYRITNSNDVSIRFVHAHMGVCPGWGGATRLTKLVGRQRALQLLGTAQGVNAAQAVEMGLIDRVVVQSESTMGETLVHFLDRFVHADPRVLHAAKRCIVAGAGADDESSSYFAAAVQKEHQIFCSLWGGELNQAAIKKKKVDGKK